MTIKLCKSTTFWIPNLINDIILYFPSTTSIRKIISLSGNPSISFTTTKMLLISFTSQIPLLLNPISILEQFLAVNIMISVQILLETSLKFSKHWNFNKVFIKFWQDFYCFDKEPLLIKSCSDQSCSHLTLPHLTLPCLISPCLIAYSILKSLIIPHHVKMCLVLWQLTIWYNYLTHTDQLSFSFPISFCSILLSPCLIL